MPKIFRPDLFTKETSRNIKKYADSGNNSSNLKAQLLKRDANFVGEGGRVVVAATENDKNVLVAVSMKEVFPKEAKTVFYNHRILHILFPYNFPKMYASYGRIKESGVSANFRERVIGRSFTKLDIVNLNLHKYVSSVEYPFWIVIDTLKKIGIQIKFDNNERNYMVNDYGDELFVDTINYSNWSEMDRDRVLNFMKQNGYSESDIRVVENSINRLLVINDPHQR